MVKRCFCNRPGARFVFCEGRFSYPTGKQVVSRDATVSRQLSWSGTMNGPGRNAVQVGQDFEVGQTKGKENRLVPVASVLSRLAARCEGRSANDLLFPARGGGYLKRPSYDSTGWFNRAVERAQVQTITLHDLRHAAASLAVSAGANVLAVSRMLGHKDPSVTLRIYADLFDSDLDAVAVNLDAKIADSVQSVSKAPADRRRPRRKTAV